MKTCFVLLFNTIDENMLILECNDIISVYYYYYYYYYYLSLSLYIYIYNQSFDFYFTSPQIFTSAFFI